MRVWLDDVRPMPENFDAWAKTADEAITLLSSGKVIEISLDHDLGETGGTGYDVASWLEEAAYLGTIPRVKWTIHSQNPVGFSNMKLALEAADRLWVEVGDDEN